MTTIEFIFFFNWEYTALAGSVCGTGIRHSHLVKLSSGVL
jgi:hypothetical protein